MSLIEGIFLEKCIIKQRHKSPFSLAWRAEDATAWGGGSTKRYILHLSDTNVLIALQCVQCSAVQSVARNRTPTRKTVYAVYPPMGKKANAKAGREGGGWLVKGGGAGASGMQTLVRNCVEQRVGGQEVRNCVQDDK